MALNRARLADIQYVADSAGALITNASGDKTWIRAIIIHNGNTTAESVQLYNVPDNAASVGTAGVSNIFFNQSIAANQTVVVEIPGPGLVLEDTNDTIQGVTTTASKVTVMFAGDTETT